jgi:hypothetical protein
MIRNHFLVLFKFYQKKAELTKGFFLRQLGHADSFGTRRFPSPDYSGFGFIGKSII